jgi:hypothetical protein
LDDVTLEVQVLNRSAEMIAGLVVGYNTWQEQLLLQLDGEPVIWRHTDTIADETYELAPGTSVRFLLPLEKIVERWAASPEDVLADGGRGSWTVELFLAGAQSKVFRFVVTGEAEGFPGAAHHPSVLFLTEAERLLEQATAGDPLPGGPTVAEVARAIELHLLGRRRESYARDPVLLYGVCRLGWLLRRCAATEPAIGLTGSYLLARDPFGPSGPEWVEAARTEHEALDLFDLGDWRGGAILYRRSAQFLPGEVLYHMAAVKQLEPFGPEADGERAALAADGLTRYQQLQIGRSKPGSAFVLGFLSGQRPSAQVPGGR